MVAEGYVVNQGLDAIKAEDVRLIVGEQYSNPSALGAMVLRLPQAAAKRYSDKIEASDTVCIMSVRGTQNSANAAADANFAKRDLDPDVYGVTCHLCKAHIGFQDGWLGLLAAGIVDTIKKDLECGKVLVTGHSMGAAISMLAVISLLNKYQVNVIGSYPFETPRVFNDRLADWFDKEIMTKQGLPVIRITHAQDPFVHMPSIYYQHAGTEVFFPLGTADDEYRKQMRKLRSSPMRDRKTTVLAPQYTVVICTETERCSLNPSSGHYLGHCSCSQKYYKPGDWKALDHDFLTPYTWLDNCAEIDGNPDRDWNGKRFKDTSRGQ